MIKFSGNNYIIKIQNKIDIYKNNWLHLFLRCWKHRLLHTYKHGNNRKCLMRTALR